MRERDESRHLAVGAGAPSDPNPDPDESGGNGHLEADDDGEDRTSAAPDTATDVVQAVADFLDDLVDDPTFAHDPAPPPP